MALICLIIMVYSSPGYVPYEYKYKKAMMTQRDAIFYEKLIAALHSTGKQMEEMYENDNLIRGSMMNSNDSP